jgi:transposase
MLSVQPHRCDVAGRQALLPVRGLRKGGAPRKYDDRLVLDSIFYVLRSGCQWRMLPRDLMPYDAAHRWCTNWRRDGTWDRIHDALRRMVRIEARRDPEPSAAALDAQSIKCSEGGAGTMRASARRAASDT